MVERVDYTTRIPTNRRNIEAANRMVHADYTPRNIYERKIRPYVEGIKKFDREKTGIAQFARNVGQFQKAQKKYRTDKGLGYLESGWKSPYEKDVGRWAGNIGYGALEGIGDLFEMGWRGAGSLVPGVDLIPGDKGYLGEWGEMQEYNPTWDIGPLSIPNPFYDELKHGQFEQGVGEAERASGLSDYMTSQNFDELLGKTGFQNYLRNYGLDLSKDLKGEGLSDAYTQWASDKFYESFGGGTENVGGYAIPSKFVSNYEGYTDKEIIDAYNKDYMNFEKKQRMELGRGYEGNIGTNMMAALSEKYDMSPDQLGYVLGGDTPHLGILEDLVNEETMPFMPDDFRFDYETPEAQKIVEENPFLSEGLPGFYAWYKGLQGVKGLSNLADKSKIVRNNPLLNAANTFYKNLYPQMSGSGGKYRQVLQGPGVAFGASLAETGDE